MTILYDMRGGRSNAGDDPNIENRMHGLGHFADLLAQRFALHVRRLGFPGLPKLDCSRFTSPTANARNNDQQLGLF